MKAMLLLLSVLAAPLAYAHLDGMPYGDPKRYCEDAPAAFGDWLTHDYAEPASGSNVWMAYDGSTAGGLYPLLPGGCAYPGSVQTSWDAHYEHALGGAILLACDAACADGTGDGANVCWGTYADHPQFPTVWVFDHGLSTAGLPTTFAVYVDSLDNVPDPTGTAPNCGDGVSDYGVNCIDHCVVPFPAGLEGSYQVYVVGSRGHVWTQ